MAVTIRQYFKGFTSLFGGIATAFGVLPVLSAILPDTWSSFVFPPLDDVFRIFAVGLTLLAMLVVYRVSDAIFPQSRRWRLHAHLILFAIAFAAALGFLVARTFFVRTLDRPALGDTAIVAVGFERTDFARRAFPTDSDFEMLRQRGTTEEEVFNLWTERSILLARIALFLPYLLFLVAAVTLCSLEVLYTLIGPATRP